VGIILSALIPPFQSPDEYDHIKRAAILANGHLLLQTRGEGGAGGEVDNGLLAYFSIFERLKFKGDEKTSLEDTINASELQWSGGKTFTAAPGTGYYFPAVYLPQSAGLLLGRLTSQSIEHSYLLARLFSMVATVAVLAFAFHLFPVNPLAIAIMLLPMSLFQFVSASIDGFSTALAVLSISLFMRGVTIGLSFERWMSWLLCASLFVVCTSRTHLLPMLILPLVVWSIRRRTLDFGLFWIAATFSVVWVLLGIKGNFVTRGGSGLATSQVVAYYMSNPLNLLQALWGTLSNAAYMDFYRRSFVGILGWLDTPLPGWFYSLVSLLLSGIALGSIGVRGASGSIGPRAALLLCAVVACVMAFLALLVTWNPVPAGIIDGVQGRYFLVPAIMAGYAVAGAKPFALNHRRYVVFAMLAILVAADAYVVPKTLVERFFTGIEERSKEGYDRQPLNALSQSTPLPLVLLEPQRESPGTIVRLGVLFATYGKKADGIAVLRLRDDTGHAVETKFALSSLNDNSYQYFDVEPRRYVAGEVRYLTGGGVTVYERIDKRGDRATCMTYEYRNGSRRSTPGCPPP